MSIVQRIVEEGVPHWNCPDCGTMYFGASKFRFCPACEWKKQQLEKEYWDNKRAGMWSIASDIVSQILANK